MQEEQHEVTITHALQMAAEFNQQAKWEQAIELYNAVTEHLGPRLITSYPKCFTMLEARRYQECLTEIEQARILIQENHVQFLEVKEILSQLKPGNLDRYREIDSNQAYTKEIHEAVSSIRKLIQKALKAESDNQLGVAEKIFTLLTRKVKEDPYVYYEYASFLERNLQQEKAEAIQAEAMSILENIQTPRHQQIQDLHLGQLSRLEQTAREMIQYGRQNDTAECKAINSRQDIRAFCVVFYKNFEHITKALDHFGWCDTFYCSHDEGPNPSSTIGHERFLDQVNIDYSKYNVCLTFSDGYTAGDDAFRKLLSNCTQNGIPVYSNQHGYDKSVYDIVRYTPNHVTESWNAMGQYWLDRFKLLLNAEPSTRRWTSIGSLKHDYLYRNFKWDLTKTNRRVLVIHEPDTDICENDSNPLKCSNKTERLLHLLHEHNIDVDFKIHPSWPTFVGSGGGDLWQPPEFTNCVNIGLEDMVHYDAVIGCWSTCLLDAAAMGIPVINIDFPYPTDNGAHWGPGETGLFPRVQVDEVPQLITGLRQDGWNYDHKKLEYFLGPLGSVNERYQDFIVDDMALKRSGQTVEKRRKIA